MAVGTLQTFSITLTSLFGLEDDMEVVSDVWWTLIRHLWRLGKFECNGIMEHPSGAWVPSNQKDHRLAVGIW